MRIIARDVNLMPLNEIDMYTSFIWTDRYSEAGDFELRVPCTESNYNLFTQSRYLTIDKSDRVMVIEKRQIKTKVNEGDEYIITGRSAETLLNRRVIMGSVSFGTAPYDEQTNDTASQNYAADNYLIWYGSMCKTLKSISSGDTFVLYDVNKHNELRANIRTVTSDEETELMESVETILATLLNVNIINPTDPLRRFVNPAWRYVFSTDPKVQEIKMTAAFSNTNLYDAVSSVLVGAGLGCKVIYNDDTETMDFSVFIGTDHSVSQSENMVVSFKNVLDNLISTDFLTNEQDYKTCAFVVGAIDDKKTRTIYTADEYGKVFETEYPNPNYRTTWCQQVSLSGTGMSYNRREVIVDASDIDRYQTTSDSGGSNGTDVAISESDYRSLLRTRGRSELMGMASTYDMNGEILPDMFYKYMVDYNLGDTITIEDRFGHAVNASITELIFSIDSGGYKAYPTIEPIGVTDGIDELINIFMQNPIYVDSDGCLVVPDIREDLSSLREKNYIAYYTKSIIDYLLDGHLIYVKSVDYGFQVVAPSLDDMDSVVLGGDISAIYSNPGAFPDANTRAIQFVKFMIDYQVATNAQLIDIKPFDDLASAIQ